MRVGKLQTTPRIASITFLHLRVGLHLRTCKKVQEDEGRCSKLYKGEFCIFGAARLAGALVGALRER
jgi:hypothetical protein